MHLIRAWVMESTRHDGMQSKLRECVGVFFISGDRTRRPNIGGEALPVGGRIREVMQNLDCCRLVVVAAAAYQFTSPPLRS